MCKLQSLEEKWAFFDISVPYYLNTNTVFVLWLSAVKHELYCNLSELFEHQWCDSFVEVVAFRKASSRENKRKEVWWFFKKLD